ncbi:hypothetical protein P5673_004400 [Acropora cervicornis]|uniref:Uncharacterized protein n=1 Tax=Acropora cervicornis TaxID=6130 RepID=A0AAD9VE93_ACRCE|nr:hypothetical protein P5673_004400 [Acropora cervicornis]
MAFVGVLQEQLSESEYFKEKGCFKCFIYHWMYKFPRKWKNKKTDSKKKKRFRSLYLNTHIKQMKEKKNNKGNKWNAIKNNLLL